MIRARFAPSSVGEHIVIDLEVDHDGDSQLWWQTLSGTPPPQPDRLDCALLALVSKAMNFTQDLHLEGPVSEQLLANMEEYRDAWTLWRPDIFRRVSFTADEVIADRDEGPGPFARSAMAAFSGGVDGTYATYAHTTGAMGYRTVDVVGALLVHGFDIPLDDPGSFELAATGARAVTDELGVPLVTMRTNWQAVADPEWQMTFSAAIASMLHLFDDRAGVALVAADNTYDHLTIPWGSNPITSPMLSSARMRLVPAGAGATRTEKVRAIGGLPSVRQNLRVCWEGGRPGRNCGHCEKCIRTKVNFLAAGHGEIPALGPLVPGELRSTRPRSTGALGIYQELQGEADLLPPEVAEELADLLESSETLFATPPSAPDEVGPRARWRPRRRR